VCNSRYHFIIPSEATLEDIRQLAAVVEGKALGRLPLSHRWVPPAPEEGVEDEHGPYNAAASVFESQDHLLHGVLHANGYGHLLRMNGSQGGSRRLIGAGLAGWVVVYESMLAGQLRSGMCSGSQVRQLVQVAVAACRTAAVAAHNAACRTIALAACRSSWLVKFQPRYS
jgi:hypothetical protein